VNNILLIFLLSASFLDPVVEKLKQGCMFEADFLQTDIWALTREEEYSLGHLFITFPDLFLLDYSDPDGRKLGFDGEFLYSIEPDAEQVLIYEAGEAGSFLYMLESCSDQEFPESYSQSGDSVCVILSGDLGQGITRIEMIYGTVDSLPIWFLTEDINGNINSYRFSNFVQSAVSPEDVFPLIVPNGYQIVSTGEYR
jgi:outer membrane lipoprotein-sorting protein